MRYLLLLLVGAMAMLYACEKDESTFYTEDIPEIEIHSSQGKISMITGESFKFTIDSLTEKTDFGKPVKMNEDEPQKIYLKDK